MYITMVNIGVLKPMQRSVVVIFSKLGNVSGGWVWGGESLPIVSSVLQALEEARHG